MRDSHASVAILGGRKESVGRAAMRRENEDPTTREGREQEAGGSQTPGGRLGSPGALRGRAVGETEKSGLIGVGACALVVMLQGAVKETPVEATLVRGVPFSIPRTMAPKNGAPPGPCDFFFNGFRLSWWLPPSLPRARGCVY